MRIVFLFLLLLFSGCVTSPKLTDMNVSLAQLRKTAESVSPQGVREVSQNGREIYSQYFTPKQGGSKARAYSIIRILGDRRPYVVSFDVIREELSDGTFEEVEQDEKMAETLKTKFQRALTEAQSSRDFIDDFRAF